MKYLYTGLAIITLLACVSTKNKFNRVKKLEISKIDSTINYFVFTTLNEKNKVEIILAEKDSVESCYLNKKYINADSVYVTLKLKSGDRTAFVGN